MKKVVIIFTLCILFSSVFTIFLSIETCKAASKRTLYVGGNGPGNYTKIQEAVYNANSEDIVFVYSGTYFENIIINKTINLIGEDKNTTIVDSNGNDFALKITANGVIITEISIQNSTKGIYIFHADLVTISQNIIQNNDIGINLLYSSKTNIFNNFITNNQKGIHLYNSSYNDINNNFIINQILYGIFFDLSSKNNNISSNNILENNLGICIWDFNSNDNNITMNDIISNKYGIMLRHQDNNIFENNFIENFIGIMFHGFFNNDIINNNFFSKNNEIYDVQENPVTPSDNISKAIIQILIICVIIFIILTVLTYLFLKRKRVR